MALLDFDENYKPPFTPKTKFPPPGKDNFEALQNFGRKEVSEDFSDKL